MGCHSIEVIGAVCQEKAATGVGAGDLVLRLTRGQRGNEGQASRAPLR